MKTILALLLVLAAFVAPAQFTNIDTSTVHVGTNTTTGTISIAAISTNAAYSTLKTNAVTVGDTLAQTQAKINANFAWLANWFATNPPPMNATNYYLNGVVDGLLTDNNFSVAGAAAILAIVGEYGAITNIVLTNMPPPFVTNNLLFWPTNSTGGGGTASNAIPIYNGGGTNLTVTNTFTLTSTTPYYTIAMVNPTNLPPVTPNDTNLCPYFPTDSSLARMTNTCGVDVTNLYPPTCTNAGPPFFLNTNFIPPVLTNACGFIVFTNYTCTNTAGPYLLDTNLGPYVYTNACGFIIYGYPAQCTNTGGAYYHVTTNLLVNECGYTIIDLFPPVCTNTVGPYGTNLTFPFPVLTNACGFIVLTNYTCTNSSDPYFANTNLGTGVYTNACGFVIFATGPCPNQNGPYFADPPLGPGVLTNACGFQLYVNTVTTGYVAVVSSILATAGSSTNVVGLGTYLPLDTAFLIFTNSFLIATNYVLPLVTNSTIVVTGAQNTGFNQSYYLRLDGVYIGLSNPSYFDSMSYISTGPSAFAGPGYYWTLANPSGYYSIFGTTVTGGYTTVNSSTPPAPTVTDGPQLISYTATNYYTNICFSIYATNAWRFYSATNATFTPFPSETINIFGNSSEVFNVTNVPTVPPPSNTYTANKGQSVVFSNTNVISYICSNGVYYGFLPGGIITIIITPPQPPGTNNPPITTNTNNPPPTCTGYICMNVGGVGKVLLSGKSMWTEAHNFNQRTGTQTSKLHIDNSGNATLIIFGAVTTTINWNDPPNSVGWTTQIPSDSCDKNPNHFPTQGSDFY